MMTVFYSKDAQFKLTAEEFSKFIAKLEEGKAKVWIPRLEVFLSGMFVWAGKKPQDTQRIALRDGTVAVNKFGVWVDEKDPNVRIDLEYYPELAKELNDEDIKKLTN